MKIDVWAALLGTGLLCVGGTLISGGFQAPQPQGVPAGNGAEPEPLVAPPPTGQPLPDVKSQKAQDCHIFTNEPITKEKVKKRIMKLGNSQTIEPGPYELTHPDGSIQIIEDLGSFPPMVVGEKLCVIVETQSSNYNPKNSHGIVYEAEILFAKSQNNMLAAKSRDTRAAVKSKQGF